MKLPILFAVLLLLSIFHTSLAFGNNMKNTKNTNMKKAGTQNFNNVPSPSPPQSFPKSGYLKTEPTTIPKDFVIIDTDTLNDMDDDDYAWSSLINVIDDLTPCGQNLSIEQNKEPLIFPENSIRERCFAKILFENIHNPHEIKNAKENNIQTHPLKFVLALKGLITSFSELSQAEADGIQIDLDALSKTVSAGGVDKQEDVTINIDMNKNDMAVDLEKLEKGKAPVMITKEEELKGMEIARKELEEEGGFRGGTKVVIYGTLLIVMMLGSMKFMKAMQKLKRQEKRNYYDEERTGMIGIAL